VALGGRGRVDAAAVGWVYRVGKLGRRALARSFMLSGVQGR
jgi:hypothetical protein